MPCARMNKKTNALTMKAISTDGFSTRVFDKSDTRSACRLWPCLNGKPSGTTVPQVSLH